MQIRQDRALPTKGEPVIQDITKNTVGSVKAFIPLSLFMTSDTAIPRNQQFSGLVWATDHLVLILIQPFLNHISVYTYPLFDCRLTRHCLPLPHQIFRALIIFNRRRSRARKGFFQYFLKFPLRQNRALPPRGVNF